MSALTTTATGSLPTAGAAVTTATSAAIPSTAVNAFVITGAAVANFATPSADQINKGTKFSFFKSYYMWTIELSSFLAAENWSLLPSLVSLTFRLTIHTGIRTKNEGTKMEAIHFPRPGEESSAADTEDIDIDEDRFMSFCIKFKYLRTFRA
jgi:hypothetical protein